MSMISDAPAAGVATATERNRWWVVVASVLGLIVGTGAISVFGFGVFLEPVSQSLGLSRGTVAVAMSLNSLVVALGVPFAGRLIDRIGVRRYLLPAILLYAASIGAFALLRPSLLMLYGLAILSGLFGIGQTPLAYSKTIAEWFDRQRGVALGIATCGVGLGTALIPQLSRVLLEHFGWRAGFVGLALAIVVFAFLPVALFIRSPCRTAVTSAMPTPDALQGMTAAETFRLRRFWLLAVAFFLEALCVNGTLTHVVPMLTDRGLTVKLATAALSGAGLAIICGRVLAGALLDRISGSLVAVGFILAPMTGLLLLSSTAAPAPAIAGAVLCGIGIGAEIDILAYLVSRYFGLRAFGTIYGTTFGIFMIGTSLGPALMGMFFDRVGSYQLLLLGFEPLLAVSCLLLLRLGPYRYAAPKRFGK